MVRITYSAWAFAKRRGSSLTCYTFHNEPERKPDRLAVRRYIVPFVAVQAVLIIGLLILLLVLRAQ